MPILVLPTSVEVRLLLGGNLGLDRPDAGLLTWLAGLLSVLTLGLALSSCTRWRAARLASFARFVNSSQPNVEHAWTSPGRLDDEERSLLSSRLFVVERRRWS